MHYDVTLLGASITSPLFGEMRLGLQVENKQLAEIEYTWTDKHFTARFVGFAPGMPTPAHPVAFISKPIEAIQALKTGAHKLPTDVFTDTAVSIEINS